MESAPAPGWRAIEIGPGGVPPELIRPNGPDAPRAVSPPLVAGPPSIRPRVFDPSDALQQQRVPESQVLPQPQPHWADIPIGFGRPQSATRRRRVLGTLALLVAVATVLGAALWSNSSTPSAVQSAGAEPGQCLAASGTSIAAVVDCAAGRAVFRVTGRHPGNADGSDCIAPPSDVVIVTRDSTSLCLDYVAVVGDCLFTGPATTRIGKVSCTSTEAGVFRVTAVLSNTIEPTACPGPTVHDLVHVSNSEVICLARP